MGKWLGGILFGAILAVGMMAVAQSSSKWSLLDIDARLSDHAQRACIFPVGGWTIVNCSNAAAATSGQLNQWSRYVVQCGDDSYIVTGDESTDSATTNDGYLPNGSWLEFMTTDTVRYISCRNKNSDSDCRYMECK